MKDVVLGVGGLICFLNFFFININLSDLVKSTDFLVDIFGAISMVVIRFTRRGDSLVGEGCGGVSVRISMISMVSMSMF